MRRIVTGHDAAGRSCVLMDDEPRAVLLEKAGGLRLTELWTTSETPAAFTSSDRARRERRIEPDPGGTVFRVIEYPPDSERLAKIRPEEHFASMGAQAAPAEKRRHPGMHRTKTLDYAIVLAGGIYPVLDEGEGLLSAGHVLVEPGNKHARGNPIDKPPITALVLR